MVIDSSALVAILLSEPDSSRLVAAIDAAPSRRVPAPTLVEAAAVLLAKAGPAGEIALDAMLKRLDIDVIEMSPDAAAAARGAYRRFGKGVGSPGVLNFGDCLAYGVAIAEQDSLLCKGADFSKTDVSLVEY